MCSWEWSDTLLTWARWEIKGWEWEDEGAAVRWEGEIREVNKTDNAWGAQAVNLQAVGILCHSCKGNLRLTGQDSQRTVPRSAVASSSQWRETVGCRAVHLASFTITKVTDKILNWSYVHGFMTMIRNGGKPGQRAAIRYTEGSRGFWSAWQPDCHSAAASLCLLSTQNVFLCISIPSLLISQEGTQSNRLQGAINIHFDGIHVTIHNHVL